LRRAKIFLAGVEVRISFLSLFLFRFSHMLAQKGERKSSSEITYLVIWFRSIGHTSIRRGSCSLGNICGDSLPVLVIRVGQCEWSVLEDGLAGILVDREGFVARAGSWHWYWKCHRRGRSKKCKGKSRRYESERMHDDFSD
jgi:hypothetical protein